MDNDKILAPTKIKSEPNLANQIWNRYVFMRDNGHLDFVKIAEICENYVFNNQWLKADKDKLDAVGRPALTINKVLPTMLNVQGVQIFNRTDTAFKPRNQGATEEVANALTKTFMQVSDNNELVWVRSDVFKDGIYTGRGFYDVRLSFEDSMLGELKIRQLNPKNVLIDPDADTYNPEGWADCAYSEWQSLNDIALIYGEEVADRLDSQGSAVVDGAEDDNGMYRDRFGSDWANSERETNNLVSRNNRRMVRVVDYQWRQLTKRDVFIDGVSGDIRPVPTGWDQMRIEMYLSRNPSVNIAERIAKRIRWTVVAGNEVLHDAWSPYEYFTIVPYFPHFSRGRTMGMAEPLLGPQELLNKTSSQELHVVNTTANSGYFVKRNALQNMTAAELEERGAQTGIVIEVDDLQSIMKIPPNPTPTGLDRISYKAEEHIKSISGVSDYMTGNAREDVSAKSVRANQAGGAANTATVQDNLNRTDFILTTVALSIIQTYYTEERLVIITSDRLTNQTEQIKVNERTPEGTIANDLTLGEYAIVITNQPDRDTFEETQYDQALSMRTEAGVKIPDSFIIQASKLKNKSEIIKAIEGDKDSPEAQAEAALAARMREAEVADKEADVMLKQAKAQAEMAKVNGAGQPEGMDASQQIEFQLKQQELKFKREEAEREDALKRYEIEVRAETERYKADLQYRAAEEKMQQENAQYTAEQRKKDAGKTASTVLASMRAVMGEDNDDETPQTPINPPVEETPDVQ